MAEGLQGSMSAARWRNVVLVAVTYLFLCALGGTLLAWVLSPVLDLHFTKILSRGVLLCAALGLVPLARLAGLTAEEIGLRIEPSARNRACRLGFLMGLGIIAPIVAFFVIVGFRVLDPSVDVLSWAFAASLAWLFVSAWLVGVFEEVLFRGVLFTWLRRYLPFLAVAGLSSVLYASVHFLEPAEIEVVPDAWYVGLVHIGDAFGGMAQLANQWDAWVALCLLGVLLSWIREELGLWWAIALHAAFVFTIRVFKDLTGRDVMNPFQSWSGEYDNFTGGLVACWLLFIFVAIALYRRWRLATPAAPGGSRGTRPRRRARKPVLSAPTLAPRGPR